MSKLNNGKHLNKLTLPGMAKAPHQYVGYSVKFRPVKFSVVTKYPSGLEGMNAFLLPFAPSVWAALFFSCIAICWTAQFSRKNVILHQLTIAMISLIGMLLKQVTPEGSKILRSSRAGPGLIWLWLFCGCNVLMDNLYTGEIFSFLSAIKVPTVPGTLPDLVGSKIPIVSTTSYVQNGKRFSILGRDTIPSYVDFYVRRNKSAEIFRKLGTRLSFVDAYKSTEDYANFLKTILALKNLTRVNSSVETRRTYVIIDEGGKLNVLTSLIRSNESRMVINAREDTPFVSIVVDQALRNCFYPIFTRRLGYLDSSGIAEKWEKLQKAGFIAYAQSLMGYPGYEIYFFANNKFKGCDAGVLSVEGPIQIKTVEPIFILCGVLLLLGLTSFIVERNIKQ